MEALKATGVCHAYGRGGARVDVLKDFALELAPGAFEVLMGPSGSGKSTFLHLAAGLLTCGTGTITIGGTEVTALSDSAAAKFRRRHVGVVFQGFNLLDTLTVAENVMLPVRLDHGTPNRDRLDALLAKLGLAGKAARRPTELSGGERQRVAIARALAHGPAIVLADEPTAALDPDQSRKVLGIFADLARQQGTTVIMVSHDPQMAREAGFTLVPLACSTTEEGPLSVIDHPQR